jgi:glycogen synthase
MAAEARACSIYRDEPGLLSLMRRNAMEKNVDWTESASQYCSMYTKVIDFRERKR